MNKYLRECLVGLMFVGLVFIGLAGGRHGMEVKIESGEEVTIDNTVYTCSMLPPTEFLKEK